MKSIELNITPEESVEIVSPALYQLFHKEDEEKSFPILYSKPKLVLRSEAHGLYLAIKDKSFTEKIIDTNIICDEDEYPFEVFLSLSFKEISHIHDFLGNILKYEKEGL